VDVTSGEKLDGLRTKGANVSTVDVTSKESISAFKKFIGEATIDLLLNIAGMLLCYQVDNL
jgi:NADP-dependent 3-hydroxy acid dehydrogenase YdfG